MPRLIDANMIPWEEHYVPDTDSNKQWDYKKELCVLKPVIDQLPTVDAVPVVHCRDCEWFKEFTYKGEPIGMGICNGKGIV